MPLALLLSPDDQAVSAISAVLEEMAVTCERPLDGVSAAQKLNSHTFDLVFVDCDNLPAAKLIFDVCRRVKGSNNPVPIAIVDGRAGLPTAFRLGAELILTKPVAKDQARTTIRTAVSRVRRVDPAQVAAQSSGAERNGPPSNAVKNESPVAADSQISVEGRARGAAVGGTSRSPGMSVPAVLQMMAEPDVAPARGARESNSPASKPTKEKAVGGAKSPARTDASEEQVEKRRSRIAQVESSEQRSRREASTENVPADQKTNGPLVAILVVVVAVGGLYASWMFEPGFRALVQPMVDRVLVAAGMGQQSHPLVPATNPEKLAVQPSRTPVNSGQSAQSSAPVAAKPSPVAASAPTAATASTTPEGATASATPSGAAGLKSVNQVLGTESSPDTGNAAVKATANTAGAPVTSGGKTPEMHAPETGTPATKAPETKSPESRNTGAGPSGTELPGEAYALVLSSKGANKRLVHSEQPSYPAGGARAQAPLVLKAVIDENGKVTGARVIQGDSALAPAAVSAVKNWRYQPFMRDGKALPFQTVVVVDFQQR